MFTDKRIITAACGLEKKDRVEVTYGNVAQFPFNQTLLVIRLLFYTSRTKSSRAVSKYVFEYFTDIIK